jgi:hypothetical protein
VMNTEGEGTISKMTDGAKFKERDINGFTI